MNRLADIILSAIALLLAALPMILIALAIRCDDGGPAFFRQIRVGKDLRHFEIIKFRSMRINQEGAGTGSAQSDDAEAKKAARAAFQTTTLNDPRITPIGRMIRTSHLDELPQLINVLKGDMSLVGVRPDTPAQEVDYDPDYWRSRHRMRPGITGVAQIGISDGGLEERSRLERQWLNEPSFRAYIRTLLGTVGKVLRRSSF